MSKYILTSKSFAALDGVHRGTGTFEGRANVVEPGSVAQPLDIPLEIEFPSYKIRVMSFEIDTDKKPNWFGVGFRVGLSTFDTINLFCHPHPGNAGMKEGDYPTRAGLWPRLFRYVEMLALQVAISKGNHITLIPFFPDSVYGSGGIFSTDWADIVGQAVALVRSNAGEAAPTPTPNASGRIPRTVEHDGARVLVTTDATRKKGQPAPKGSSGPVSNVVLSCFSRGRQLAATLNSSATGLRNSVKEVWDFDGVGPKCPAPRVISYDQQSLNYGAVDAFHVPPKRWIKYHKMVVANVHGDVPALLARHASHISRVGK